MKCVGAQYLCALYRIANAPLRRTIHCVWVPDEEIGGPDGMKTFVKTDDFQQLRLGMMMDEGLADTANKFVVYEGERTGMWIKVRVEGGPVGHSSKLPDNTANYRRSKVVSSLKGIRDANSAKLAADSTLRLGDVTSVNVTVLQAGITNDGGKTWAYNVIPGDAFMVVDIRATFDDFHGLVSQLRSLTEQNGAVLEFLAGGAPAGPEVVNDRASTTAYWNAIEKSLTPFGAPIERQIFPAATDSRYVRRAGVPAFGFSPMRNLPSLLHDHNEYLPRSTYLEGIDVYTSLISSLASLPGDATSKL